MSSEIKKRKKTRIHSHYQIREGGVKRIHPFCERCGPGYFMADHGNRWACGNCGFTRYKRNR